MGDQLHGHLEREIDAVLVHLRLERQVYPQAPPKVEYRLTEWGQAMCPALDSLLEWAAQKPAPPPED